MTLQKTIEDEVKKEGSPIRQAYLHIEGSLIFGGSSPDEAHNEARKGINDVALSIIKAVRDEVLEGSFVLNSEAVKGEIEREKRIRFKFQEIINSLE